MYVSETYSRIGRRIGIELEQDIELCIHDEVGSAYALTNTVFAVTNIASSKYPRYTAAKLSWTEF